MSKILLKLDTPLGHVELSSFFGGKLNGECYQITGPNGYVQLTAAAVAEVIGNLDSAMVEAEDTQ